MHLIQHRGMIAQTTAVGKASAIDATGRRRGMRSRPVKDDRRLLCFSGGMSKDVLIQPLDASDDDDTGLCLVFVVH
jgi:hypothetical protein